MTTDYIAMVTVDGKVFVDELGPTKEASVWTVADYCSHGYWDSHTLDKESGVWVFDGEEIDGDDDDALAVVIGLVKESRARCGREPELHRFELMELVKVLLERTTNVEQVCDALNGIGTHNVTITDGLLRDNGIAIPVFGQPVKKLHTWVKGWDDGYLLKFDPDQDSYNPWIAVPRCTECDGYYGDCECE